jgi:acetyl esterase/lipase
VTRSPGGLVTASRTDQRGGPRPAVWLALAAVLVVGVVAALALAGGGGDGTEAGAPGPDTGPLETTAPPPEQPPVTTAPPVTEPQPEVLTVEPEQHGEGYATYRYGPFPENVLDLHAPVGAAPGDEPRPVLVYLHSGGWVSGSRLNMADFVSAQIGRGWFVAAIDYRLAPDHPFPAANEDVDRALRWLRLHSEPLGIDPEDLVLIGTSSGGHLAMVAGADPGRHDADDLTEALADTSPRPAGVISVSGPSDLLFTYNQDEGWGHPTVGAYLGCGDACDRDLLWAASPQAMVTEDPPPGLFIFGRLDSLVPVEVNGWPLQERWAEAGGDATVVVAEEYGHNLAFGAGIDPAEFNGWLDRVTGRAGG